MEVIFLTNLRLAENRLHVLMLTVLFSPGLVEFHY